MERSINYRHDRMPHPFLSIAVIQKLLKTTINTFFVFYFCHSRMKTGRKKQEMEKSDISQEKKKNRSFACKSQEMHIQVRKSRIFWYKHRNYNDTNILDHKYCLYAKIHFFFSFYFPLFTQPRVFIFFLLSFFPFVTEVLFKR